MRLDVPIATDSERALDSIAFRCFLKVERTNGSKLSGERTGSPRNRPGYAVTILSQVLKRPFSTSGARKLTYMYMCTCIFIHRKTSEQSTSC